MRTYSVKIIKSSSGRKTIEVEGLILSTELRTIKEKLGDINKYPVGKKFKIKC